MLSTLLLFIAAGPVSASLSGSVGPITSYTEKAATKVCNIVDYGASTNDSDMSTALTSAWDDCLTGGLVYIPPGSWSLAVFPELKDGVSNAVQLDGVIHRTGSDGDQMLSFRNCQDFEFFSGNSKGALQGYGYEYLADGDYGPRMMRFQDMGNFSIHGIALIDSPSYYLTLDTVSNGEIYNIIMRGPTTIGATDAIDVWGDNVWVHDIEATNGDECVTVKSPSSNFLIESIYCNLSGGNAIGSLSTGTDVHDITYRHIYANGADPCYVKSSGGNGTVKNILWENVIVRDATYPLAINSNWESTEESADGVFFTNFTYRNWHGYNSENARPIIRMECPSDTPCTDITFDNVNLWSADSSYASEICWNAYGTGKCLRTEEDTLSAYTSSIILTATP
ncbi:pectin lyase-like protein [Penicillium herquei]|nr:pectin lyase-like protein [Penicillium herquei]